MPEHSVLASIAGQILVVSPANGPHGLTSCPCYLWSSLEAREGSPWKFPATNKQGHGSGPLLPQSHDHPGPLTLSVSRNSSHRSAEYPGEAVPHHPGLPKAHPGHWWASFFFGKPTLPYMATVLESPERWASSQASSNTIPWDLPLWKLWRSSLMVSLTKPTQGTPNLSGHPQASGGAGLFRAPPPRQGRLQHEEAVGFFYIKITECQKRIWENPTLYYPSPTQAFLTLWNSVSHPNWKINLKQLLIN